MATPIQANGTLAQTSNDTTRGFKLPCPKCGEHALRVYLENVHVVQCGECEEEFDPAEQIKEMEQQLKTWKRLLAWCEMAPAIEE